MSYVVVLASNLSCMDYTVLSRDFTFTCAVEYVVISDISRSCVYCACIICCELGLLAGLMHSICIHIVVTSEDTTNDKAGIGKARMRRRSDVADNMLAWDEFVCVWFVIVSFGTGGLLLGRAKNLLFKIEANICNTSRMKRRVR